jgi:hypothetical protein
MPYLGTPSDIMAIEFIRSNGVGLPKGISDLLKDTKLDFLLDWYKPDNDKLPTFWKGAELDSPQWRCEYMKKEPTFPPLPFEDDLTDLVISTLCHQNNNLPKSSEQETKVTEAQGTIGSSSLLGKRRTPSEEPLTTGGEKRQKALQGEASPQGVINTIEHDEDESIATASIANNRLAKAEEQGKSLSDELKILKEQNRQLVASYSKLKG